MVITSQGESERGVRDWPPVLFPTFDHTDSLSSPGPEIGLESMHVRFNHRVAQQICARSANPGPGTSNHKGQGVWTLSRKRNHTGQGVWANFRDNQLDGTRHVDRFPRQVTKGDNVHGRISGTSGQSGQGVWMNSGRSNQREQGVWTHVRDKYSKGAGCADAFPRRATKRDRRVDAFP